MEVTKKISILIVDDHNLIREVWSYILNKYKGFEVVGDCGTAEEAIEKAGILRPDIVLLDIMLPGMIGIDAIQEIIDISPNSKILGVSMHTHPRYARLMIKKGASGYLTKSSSRQEMIDAILALSQGKRYLCAEIRASLLEQLDQKENEDALKRLSPRQFEIVSYLKKGYSSKDIAEAIKIDVHTVQVHRHNILKKLKLKNTAALVNFVNTYGQDRKSL